GLTECLLQLGFESGRLKTGTPPRLNKNSINWEVLEPQPGDENPQPFSFRTDIAKFPVLPQVDCHITYTDASVHKILEKGFNESPMFTGLISGVGPRYCPSIEDKIVRFKDKERHHLFLEPEGLDSDLIYLNGFSTSLPAEIQLEAIQKIRGLENVEMIRPGYAVEYDFFPPHQVDLTLETKLIEGLYFAGQINGTSGYEEAAAQGLVAGVNASAKILKKEELILKRSEAYIGVLIDDLVNKSTEEPYRMFTSRAEHRLLLRQDNSDIRLSGYGHKYGLITDELIERVKEKKESITIGRQLLETIKIPSKEINPLLSEIGENESDSSDTIAKLVKRPELKLADILKVKSENDSALDEIRNNDYLIQQLETELKYEGYIKRQEEVVKKVEKFEELHIPLSFNYSNLNSLSTEGREKLTKVKPRSIGQASRISGVTASDISILLVYLRK
ncbi:MAG: tRNA uridine-5-carboxymethylaminomethyl(34) synthesis enzyme MnmG, partial [Ignavibacteria bacterium]|nr:tRNA uridine-5-carboxymethylaminomethyl(34) synthesis enzyme MnmG [Ignavibacteria bacterium]